MPYKLGQQFKFTQTEGGGVLLDLTKGEYWQLNELGALLVDRLSGGGLPRDVVEELAAAYPDSADRVDGDVRRLLDQLVGIGAIDHE